MFGYVRPFKPELKINEFDTYKGMYCGLCKQLGRDYGLLARMTLSYDFAFLAMLSMGTHGERVQFKRETCIAHPFTKRPCMCANGDLSYVAACAMMMLYYKWKDNIADSGFFKRCGYRVLGPSVRRSYKKAVKRYPELDAVMQNTLARQQQVEAAPNCTVDMAAESSSRALALIFEQLAAGETQKKVLHRFGFLLGRWIYLMDALDDLEDDRKSGSFNPLLRWEKTRAAGAEHPAKEVKRQAEAMINVTHGEMALAYELVELNRYKTILDNIIYLGLPAVKNQVLSNRRKKPNDRPL
ncbi:MAG: DUF5685 family protein [Oscillospiraceae bacterium]